MKQIITAIIKSWFNVLIILLIGFSVYWFGIRPVEIRKLCSMVKGHTDAVPAQAASPNWPACQNEELNPCSNPLLNPLNVPGVKPPQNCPAASATSSIYVCSGPITARAASDWEKPASADQYEQCLRQEGL